MALIESYIKTDIGGQTHELELHHQADQDRWHVVCWYGYDPENLECAWDKDYKVVGYVDGNPNRQITEPFTEAEARAEFERWRT